MSTPNKIIGTNARLLSIHTLSEMLDLSKATLARWRIEGYGPRWIKIGRKAVAYLSTDVDAWLEAQSVATTMEAKQLDS